MKNDYRKSGYYDKKHFYNIIALITAIFNVIIQATPHKTRLTALCGVAFMLYCRKRKFLTIWSIRNKMEWNAA